MGDDEENDRDGSEREPSDAYDPAVKSALEKLSREKPAQVTEIMAMMGIGPAPNPLHRKMNEAHITQVLELAANHDEREYNLRKAAEDHGAEDGLSARRYTFGALASVLVFLAIVLVVFRNQPNVLVPVLTGVGGLLTGFLGGWGYATSRE